MQHPSKGSKFLAKYENTHGEERGDEREKKRGIEERGEREANPDLQWGVVPQCVRLQICLGPTLNLA